MSTLVAKQAPDFTATAVMADDLMRDFNLGGALLGAANRAKQAGAEKQHEKVTIDDLQKED